MILGSFLFFFFQAEDGIRDADVTGVQTCALPISLSERRLPGFLPDGNQEGGQGDPGQKVQFVGRKAQDKQRSGQDREEQQVCEPTQHAACTIAHSGAAKQLGRPPERKSLSGCGVSQTMMVESRSHRAGPVRQARQEAMAWQRVYWSPPGGFWISRGSIWAS